jgi:predicted GNAT family N-acyltransferase
MSDLQVLRVTTMSEMVEALYIRRTVFTEEQGIDAEVDVDEHDGDPSITRTAVHVLAKLDGQPVATARMVLGESTDVEAHIGRVAVLEVHRGKNFGRAVMEALQDIARDLGYREIVLGAEVTAAGFYERLGYVCEGDTYMLVGVLQQDMRLKL